MNQEETKNSRELEWADVGPRENFPPDGGIAVRCQGRQLAVFYFADRDEWYATDNRCPHKGDMVLGRGLIGDKSKEPIVACPMHKKVFSLRDGRCLTDEQYSVNIYPVKIADGRVLLGVGAAQSAPRELCEQSV